MKFLCKNGQVKCEIIVKKMLTINEISEIEWPCQCMHIQAHKICQNIFLLVFGFIFGEVASGD